MFTIYSADVTGNPGNCSYISFEAKGQTIRVALPRGVAVKESLAKIRKE